jgi:hypothetical protein
MRAAGRDERMGSARGPNKRIRKKGRKKEECEAHFVLDIEIPIQGDLLRNPATSWLRVFTVRVYPG